MQAHVDLIPGVRVSTFAGMVDGSRVLLTDAAAVCASTMLVQAAAYKQAAPDPSVVALEELLGLPKAWAMQFVRTTVAFEFGVGVAMVLPVIHGYAIAASAVLGAT